MRAGTYSVPAVAGDSEAGEMAVFFFGKGQGGDHFADDSIPVDRSQFGNDRVFDDKFA